MGKIINVGIIGQGRSGRGIHGNHLISIPRRFRIKAAADPLPDRRRRAEEEYGCDTYASWRSLLKRDDIDLIVNAGPTRTHVSQSLECLKAGFHVLCEKPLTRKLSDVDNVIRAAKKARRVMAVFQSNRFQPAYEQVKKVINSGVLGRIVLIKSQRCNFGRRWDWQTLRRNFGGSLMNTGAHNLDQLLKFFPDGVMPEVWCVMDRALTYGDAEDHVKLLLKAPGHPTIDLEVSSCCAYAGKNFNVFGTRGGLLAGGDWVEWKYFDPKKQTKRALTREPLSDAQGNPMYGKDDIKWTERSWKFEGGNPFHYTVVKSYEVLYRTITKGTPLAVTLQDVRRQVAVTEECYRQNPPGKMPHADVPAEKAR